MGGGGGGGGGGGDVPESALDAWPYGLWRMQRSSMAWVRQSCRRRYRIESSYRLLEWARATEPLAIKQLPKRE